MAKPRDYRKEYQRRIALAKRRSKALGRAISRAQARGHARASRGEISVAALKRNRVIRPERESTLRRLAKALRAVFGGKPVTAAAKKVRMAPATLKRLGTERGALKWIGASKPGVRRYSPAGAEFRVLTSDGKMREGVTFDRPNASTMGTYWNAIQAARNTNAPDPLQPWRGRVVTDVYGKKYRLLARLDRLNTIFDEMPPEEEESFNETLYRKLGHAA